MKPVRMAIVEPQLTLASDDSALVVRQIERDCHRCSQANRWCSDARNPACAWCRAPLGETEDAMSWAVVRVNDDGRHDLVNQGMCALAAEKVAGALRDASSEDLIEAGWNFLPRILGGNIDGGEAQSGSRSPRNTEQKVPGREPMGKLAQPGGGGRTSSGRPGPFGSPAPQPCRFR